MATLDPAAHHAAGVQTCRRESPRVRGPFDGRRRGALTTTIRIHDLSASGCLIEAYYDVVPRRRLTIEVELPYEGWVTLHAETVYSRQDFGFAVRFVDMTSDMRERLERVVDRLLRESSADLD